MHTYSTTSQFGTTQHKHGKLQNYLMSSLQHSFQRPELALREMRSILKGETRSSQYCTRKARQDIKGCKRGKQGHREKVSVESKVIQDLSLMIKSFNSSLGCALTTKHNTQKFQIVISLPSAAVKHNVLTIGVIKLLLVFLFYSKNISSKASIQNLRM